MRKTVPYLTEEQIDSTQNNFKSGLRHELEQVADCDPELGRTDTACHGPEPSHNSDHQPAQQRPQTKGQSPSPLPLRPMAND